MNKEVVEKDMSASSAKFKSLFVPIIKDILKHNKYDSRIYQVEDLNEEIAKLLDLKCGIDYIFVYENLDLCCGIGARVQYDKNWRTFTVRAKRESGATTELKKREYSINNSGIYPGLTTQGYVKNNEVLGLAIIKTKDLIEYIRLKSPKMKINHTGEDKTGQANFIVCEWSDIIKHKFNIMVYDKEQGINYYDNGKLICHRERGA